LDQWGSTGDGFIMSSSAHRTILLISALAACLCMAYVAGFGGYQVWNTFKQQPDPAEPVEVFWEVWERVEEHFYGEVPSPTERTYGAIRESLLLLDDPYTVFVEPQPRELERDTMRGTFGGIGIILWRNVDGQIILSPLPESPAERGGVRDGDVLIAVDGEKTTDETTEDDIRAWLHGEVGTPVTLTISRPPTPPLDFTITRAEIQVPSVIWRVLEQAPGIGYVRINSFTERTGDELATAIQGLLREEQVSSLILDLRDNSGGLVEASVATAGQFLHNGDMLIERYRDQRRNCQRLRNRRWRTARPRPGPLDRGIHFWQRICATDIRTIRRIVPACHHSHLADTQPKPDRRPGIDTRYLCSVR
jgi:C-terminal peptidase prc